MAEQEQGWVVPILGQPNGDDGAVWDLQSTITSAIGTASVLFRSEDGKTLDGAFDTKLAMRIVNEIMSNVDAHVHNCIVLHNQIQKEKRKAILEKKDWHDSPDPMVWADKFVEMFEGREIGTGEAAGIERIDAGTMVSWFASAMCAEERRLRRIASASAPQGPRIHIAETINVDNRKGRPVADNPQA